MASFKTLSWNRNGDSYDVAMVASRLAARGRAVWWCTRSSEGVEAGDYVIEADEHVAASIAKLGLKVSTWEGTQPPPHAERLVPARVALLGGKVSAYPYFGFCALTLVRLGLTYQLVDGPSIADGALEDANLLVLPGGFSTWGLDSGESAPGADAQTRAFLERGGACIGACGGANYLSMGRPGWTGTAAACPRFPHEYLYSGVGVVTLKIEDERLGIGLPPTIDLPYYHGPIYDEWGPGVRPLARFHEFGFPGHLFINNPLERPFFDKEMRGRAAILATDGPRGRAILLSPHSEMGDLVRKYMALDGYVRHYLPIRGKQVMDETLAFYRATEAPSFRLFLNSVRMLTGASAPSPSNAPASESRSTAGGKNGGLAARSKALHAEVKAALADVGSRLAATVYDDVVRGVVGDLERRAEAIPALAGALAELPPDSEIAGEWGNITVLAPAALTGPAVNDHEIPHRLMNVELVIALAEAWRRLVAVEHALGPA